MRGANPYGPTPVSAPKRVPNVVNMEQPDHPALASSLLRALQEQRKQAADQLILSKDWADFEKRRGLVHGLDAAISLCETERSRLEA